MGEVYLAEDTKLDRKVAFRILPEKPTIEGERIRRFVLEAKSASTLKHLNIITIYEIGETGNRHFIAAGTHVGGTLAIAMGTGQFGTGRNAESVV